MKKYWAFFVTAIMLTGLLFIRCKNESAGTESGEGHLLKLDTIRDQYNAKREQKDWTVITHGNVNIEVKDNMIMLYHIPDHGEELITYFFQTDTKYMDLKSDSLGMSEVLFLGRNLIIHCFNKHKPLLFTVEDMKVPAYLIDFTDVKQYIGYGLGARKFAKDGLRDNVPFCLCKKLGSPSDDCIIGGDGGAHGCASGTPDGSCEVSCSEIAFACCDQKK